MTGSIMTPRGLEKPPPVKGSGTTSTLWAHTGQRLDRLRVDPGSTKVSRSAASDAGRRDRLLDAHPEVDHVGDDVGDTADDPAAPRRSNGEEGLAVPEQQHGRHVVHPRL